MFENIVGQLLSALLAIVVGVGGFVFFYIFTNWLVGFLPDKWQPRLRPWVFLGPSLALLGFFLVYPTLNTLYLSFFDAQSNQFVGLANYEWAVTSRDIHIALRNNLMWIIVVVSFTIALGLFFAILADRVKYEPIVKSIIFLPLAISAVSASVVFRFIYAFKPLNVPQIGILNQFIVTLGFEPIGWLVNTSTNNFALMAVMIWLQTGFAMIVLSSAIKGIPIEIIEAASIDGANEWQIFSQVTIPLISSTIAVIATTMIINVLKVFDIVLVMTAGNLGTEVLANRMIKEMFDFRNFGRGSTVAVILLLAIIPVMIVNIKQFKQQEEIR